jgi:hypothetical protein
MEGEGEGREGGDSAWASMWKWPWRMGGLSEEEAAAEEVEVEKAERAAASEAARAAAEDAYKAAKQRDTEDAARAAAEAAARDELTGGGQAAAGSNSGVDDTVDERVAVRDEAVRRLLVKHPRCRSLRAAVGCSLSVPEAEVRKRALKLLRLLHPDFSLNMQLKGTKAHVRIEAAFKRLTGLRDDATS